MAVYEDVGIPARLRLPSRRVLTSESMLTAAVRCAHMHGVTLVDVSPIGRWDPELVHVALDEGWCPHRDRYLVTCHRASQLGLRSLRDDSKKTASRACE